MLYTRAPPHGGAVQSFRRAFNVASRIFGDIDLQLQLIKKHATSHSAAPQSAATCNMRVSKRNLTCEILILAQLPYLLQHVHCVQRFRNVGY